MHTSKQNVLLISMPFAGTNIPSIQLSILETYLKERNTSIKTMNLYLKAAEIYNIKNYYYLIYPPNDSYTAQIIYSKYVFPDHYKKNKEKFKGYFEKLHESFSFEEYVKKTDTFYKWVFENIDFKSYEIIGFTLNYGQFLPSLAVAKKIKEISPEKKIVFGGSRTVGELGKKVLESFEYIDFIVSGDGEEPLFLLASGETNYDSIPNLIYKTKEGVKYSKLNTNIDLNNLPLPSYDSFYIDLYNSSEEIQQNFQYNGILPVEISRGCWWNKCSFCNLSLQHKQYREKKVNKIVGEIDFLSKKYKMLSFQIIGNTLPVNDCRDLCEKIIDLNKDFTFFAEARADRLKSKDYNLLKKAGFTNIQIGIESFSKNYLKKMNKGARVIDNIAALKFCREEKINNSYNLIFDYPNEETIDFEETVKNIELSKYLGPPKLCQLRVVYGSKIQCKPDLFNIKSLEDANVDKIMFPQEFLDKKFNFVYDFKRKKEIHENPWKKLASSWKKTYEEQQINAVKRKTSLEKLVFYYKDGVDFIKIYDKRHGDNTMIYVLNKDERDVFLACNDVVSETELKQDLKHIKLSELEDILKSFCDAGIVYKEDEWYLSLPLSYRRFYKNEQIQKKDSKLQVLN